MRIPTTMRPGVFTELRVHSAGAAGRPREAGVVAVAQTGTGVTMVRSPLDAQAFGSGSALCRMAMAMLEAGISPVYAAPVIGGDYAAAFAALEETPVYLAACDGGCDLLGGFLDRSCQGGAERIGVLAVADPDAALAAAKALNHPHAVVVCGGGERVLEAAAAFAAAAARSDAGGSLNGLPLLPAGGDGGKLAASRVEELLAGGVVPFETLGGEIVCVRAVTSCLSREGVADRTFSELSTVLAVDEAAACIRQAVASRLRGMKNNAAARISIGAQIVVELENLRLRGLVDSYLPPEVIPHPQDAAVCVATVRFQVAPEISQIVLCAEITV